jgi:predicted nucleic acid-binding protein
MSQPNTPEPVRRWAANPPQWLDVLEPKHIEDIPSLGREGMRGDGDRAVISLAREEGADFVVMDDLKARREAKKRGLRPVWMLEVLDEAAATIACMMEQGATIMKQTLDRLADEKTKSVA